MHRKTGLDPETPELDLLRSHAGNAYNAFLSAGAADLNPSLHTLV